MWASNDLYIYLIRDRMIDMSNEDTRKRVAAEVRAAAARADLRQSDVARAAHISPASLNRKWRGRNAYTVDELVSISRALGTDPADLLPRTLTSAVA